MIDTRCVDGTGSNNAAQVKEDALLVSTTGSPPPNQQRTKFFGQMLTDDGLSTGSSDMGIDGSSSHTDFYIDSDDNDDIFLTKLSVIVGYGAAAPLYDFVDSGSALTNGILVSYIDAFGESITIGNPKNNYSFLRFALESGLVPTAWELRNLGASNDYGYIVSINFISMIPPYGIQLYHGTNARLSVRIRDDCTDADTFNMRAFGFKRLN